MDKIDAMLEASAKVWRDKEKISSDQVDMVMREAMEAAAKAAHLYELNAIKTYQAHLADKKAKGLI